MKVSVIVPLYYGKKYVSSILAMLERNRRTLKENYKDFAVEIIFVNDSPDEEIVLQGGKEVRILENENNVGIHASRVKGLSCAIGEYILFLDQDDIITDHFLLSQLQCIGEADAVVCNGYYRELKLIYDVKKMPVINRETIFTTRNMIISPGQVLIRRDSIPKEWKQQIMSNSGVDDFFLWILMVVNNRRIVLNHEVLYTHVENGSNTSWNWGGMIKSIQEMVSYLLKNEKLSQKEKDEIKLSTDQSIFKMNKYMNLENKWCRLHTLGISIDEYLKKNNCYDVAVYGYGIIGGKLVSELQQHGINIKYIVEKDETNSKSEIPTYKPTDIVPYVELLIITPLFAYNEIVEIMSKKAIGKILSIEEIVDQLLQ